MMGYGYGGSRNEDGQAVGRPGDEGIDGIISEDRLGLDVIYLQAKKWDGTVGRTNLHCFKTDNGSVLAGWLYELD